MSKTNCIFCRVIDKDIESELVVEGDSWIAINDINPKAPVHVLIMPRKHIESVNELEDKTIAADLLLAVKETVNKLNIKHAYQVRIHTGESAGQTVFHLHLHVLGGWTKKQAELE